MSSQRDYEDGAFRGIDPHTGQQRTPEVYDNYNLTGLDVPQESLDFGRRCREREFDERTTVDRICDFFRTF